MKRRGVLTGKQVPFFGLTIVTVFLAAASMIGPRVEAPCPTGNWLTALEFRGERPLEIVITFSQADAGSVLGYGQGRWNRVSATRFSIALTMPAEMNGAPERSISGTLVLDELGGLRGPVIAERLDASGRVVDSIPGVAKAKRIALRGGS